MQTLYLGAITAFGWGWILFKPVVGVFLAFIWVLLWLTFSQESFLNNDGKKSEVENNTEMQTKQDVKNQSIEQPAKTKQTAINQRLASFERLEQARMSNDSVPPEESIEAVVAQEPVQPDDTEKQCEQKTEPENETCEQESEPENRATEEEFQMSLDELEREKLVNELKQQLRECEISLCESLTNISANPDYRDDPRWEDFQRSVEELKGLILEQEENDPILQNKAEIIRLLTELSDDSDCEDYDSTEYDWEDEEDWRDEIDLDEAYEHGLDPDDYDSLEEYEEALEEEREWDSDTSYSGNSWEDRLQESSYGIPRCDSPFFDTSDPEERGALEMDFDSDYDFWDDRD